MMTTALWRSISRRFLPLADEKASVAPSARGEFCPSAAVPECIDGGNSDDISAVSLVVMSLAQATFRSLRDAGPVHGGANCAVQVSRRTETSPPELQNNYFDSLRTSLRCPTLWVPFSMLRRTIRNSSSSYLRIEHRSMNSPSS